MGKAKAVTQPSYQSQLQENINAQGAVYPQLLGLERQYAPQQTAIAGQLQNQAFGQGVGMVGQYSPILQQIFNQSQQQAIQGNALYNKMYTSVLDDLSAGRDLTAGEQIQATQGALQGLAQAGRANSNASIFNQILARSNYANQRYQQRLSNAGSVLSQMPESMGYKGAAGTLIPSSLGAANTIGNFMLNPESGYAQNIQDANQSAKQAAANANAGLMNGIIGGVLGAGASILGGPIGASLFASSAPAAAGAGVAASSGGYSLYNGGASNFLMKGRF